MRTDLVSHVSKLLRTCESIKSRGAIEKILDIGVRLLRGSRRAGAKRLLQHVELVMRKVELNGVKMLLCLLKTFISFF